MKPERLKKALVLEVITDLLRLPGWIHSLPVSQSRARCGRRCLWILSGRRLIHVPLTLVIGEHDLPQEKVTFQPSVGLSNYVGGNSGPCWEVERNSPQRPQFTGGRTAALIRRFSRTSKLCIAHDPQYHHLPRAMLANTDTSCFYIYLVINTK